MFAMVFSALQATIAALTVAGLMSIGPLQSGRVNVLYYPGPVVDPNPCVVDVSIFDGHGNQVKFQEFSLQPGQSGALTFNRSDLNGGGSQGIFTEQASIQNTCDPSDENCDTSLCNISQSIEAVDAFSGDTRALLDGPVRTGFIRAK